MENKSYEKKIAYLEFVNDQLSTEITYIDQLLRLIGFPDGIATIKTAAQEVIEEEDLSE